MITSDRDAELALLTPVMTAALTPSAVTEGVPVLMSPLHLDEVPEAMEKMGWVIGAKMMRRWLNTQQVYRMEPSVRGGMDSRGKPVNYTNLPAAQLDEKIITMDWALKYDRVSEMFEHSVLHWNTRNGIDRLRDQLRKHAGWEQGKAVSLGHGVRTAKELELQSQVNSRSFGEYTDVFDDFYAAMFQANIKVAVRGKTRRLWASHSDVFEVEKVGVYLRDTYDFNGGWVEEFLVGLGVWSRDRMLTKRETLDYRSSSHASNAERYPGFVALKNGDFRRWQDKNGKGGDFFVFSDISWVNSHVDHIVL